MTDKSNNLTTLVERQEKQKREKCEKEAEVKAERNKKLIPLIALIVCNIIFLSLDARAIQAVYLITESALLTAFTVSISGGLALLWFDVFYPHGKKHRNQPQERIAVFGAVMAIGLSAVLAVADYLVISGGVIDLTFQTILWVGVIAVTIAQGGLVARFWMIDKYIEAEAKREETRAEKTDQADEVGILRAKLTALRSVLTEVVSLKNDFGSVNVEKVATLLDIPLPDMDGDGIPDYRDPVDNRAGKPFQPNRPAPHEVAGRLQPLSYAKDAEAEKLAANPTNGGRKNP